MDEVDRILSDRTPEGLKHGRTARENEFEARHVAKKMVIMIVAVLLLGILAGWLFRDQLTWLGNYLVGEYGPRGIFFSVFFIDWVPMPATNEPILLLGISADMSFWTVFWPAASASVVAAWAAYWAGRFVDAKTSFGHSIAMAYPGIFRWIRDKGAVGIAIAALVPLPFSVFCWAAGIVHLKFRNIFLIGFLRIPKTLFYLWLIHAGWGLTPGG